jgi:4a-hydroxytetrahydrobiopterin dehydratase
VVSLSEAEIQTRLAAVPGWTFQNGEITRTYQLRDFPSAILLVNAAALLAEAAGHHPDIDIRYNKVKFALVTHDAGGITEKDFDLAARIDALPLLK